MFHCFISYRINSVHYLWFFFFLYSLFYCWYLVARNLSLGINKTKLICLSSRLLLDLMILYHSNISLNKFLLSYFSKWTIIHKVCSWIIVKAVWSCCCFTTGFFVNKQNSVSLMYLGLRKKLKPQAKFLSYSLCVLFLIESHVYFFYFLDIKLWKTVRTCRELWREEGP